MPAPTRQSRLQSRREARRQEIAREALRRYLAADTGDFVVAEVAQALGVSQASIFYYFPGGKDEVTVLALWELICQELDRVTEEVARAESGVDALSTLVRARVQGYLEAPRAGGDSLRLVASGTLPPERLEEFIQRINRLFDAVEARVQPDVTAGLLVVDMPVRRLAMLVNHLCTGLLLADSLRRSAGGGSLHGIEDLGEDLVQLVRRGLLSPSYKSCT